MIEALVAMVLAMVGLLGILNLIVHSLRLNTDVTNRFAAANLAAEGIEVVKNLIDGNYAAGRLWNDGLDDGIYEMAYDCVSFNNPAVNCRQIAGLDLAANPDVLFEDRAAFLVFSDNRYDYQDGDPTVFKRIIIVRNQEIDYDNDGLPADDEVIVSSLVRWSERGRAFTVELEDHFFNWRQPSQEEQPPVPNF